VLFKIPAYFYSFPSLWPSTLLMLIYAQITSCLCMDSNSRISGLQVSWQKLHLQNSTLLNFNFTFNLMTNFFSTNLINTFLFSSLLIYFYMQSQLSFLLLFHQHTNINISIALNCCASHNLLFSIIIPAYIYSAFVAGSFAFLHVPEHCWTFLSC
jgi:hypothetical protein